MTKSRRHRSNVKRVKGTFDEKEHLKSWHFMSNIEGRNIDYGKR